MHNVASVNWFTLKTQTNPLLGEIDLDFLRSLPLDSPAATC